MPDNGINVIDRQILEILQLNGRESSAEIARQVGLAPSAVIERIKKLEAKGVILSYNAKLDKREVGLSVTAFVAIKTSNYGNGEDELLAKIPQVLEVYDIAGEDSYLIKVCVIDTIDLSRLLREEIRAIPDIVSTKTTIVLQTAKESVILPLNVGEVKDEKKKNKGKKNV